MSNSLILNSYLFLTKLLQGFVEKAFLCRKKKGLEDAIRSRERFGVPSFDRPNGKLIWVHSASVGESLLALTLIERLSINNPELHFLITTNTVSSGKIVNSMLPENGVHQFLPYDFLPITKKFLNHWKPSIGLIIESEFWPALISETNRRKIPLLLINGRMSQKSFRRWKRYPKLSRTLLNKFILLLVQSPEVHSQFSELGVCDDKLIVTGQLKQVSRPLTYNQEKLSELEKLLKHKKIWVAASTHDGEEEIIAKAYKLLMDRLGNKILLIIVPRYPERGKEIKTFLKSIELNSDLRSEGKQPGIKEHVYIADTIGELGLWYRIATVCFVGGSLVRTGGHNPYEPALLGCPIVHGKFFESFTEPYLKLAELGGAQMISNSQELANAVEKVFDPITHSIFSRNGKLLDQGDKKAIEKTLENIQSFL